MSSISWYVRNFIQNVKRLIRYIPVIWESRDFDYRYAIDLFQLKLEDIANFLESDRAMSVGSKQRADRIRMILRLMKKVYDDEYGVEYQRIIESKYGKESTGFHFVDDQNPDYKRLVWNYEKMENADEIRDEIDKQFELSKEKQKRAHKLLWDLIEHNIQHWWD
jgi:hypothetical protein